MGREVRRVPKDWEHSQDNNGYIPLFDNFSKSLSRWQKDAAMWQIGFRESYTAFWETPKRHMCRSKKKRLIKKSYKTKTFLYVRKTQEQNESSFIDWDGECPSKEDYMPEWPGSEKTHYQLYETCTEGTPISPVMGTPEELAKWLVDNSASAFGDSTASCEAWLKVAKGCGSVSAIIGPTGLVNGVDAQLAIDGKTEI